MSRPGQIDQRGILVFWAPLAATWLMMSVEGPFLAAVIARLAEPKYNLAAFGVAFSIALVVEAPIIAILSASTALVEGPRTLRTLRRFTFALNGAITAAMVLIITEPVYGWLARDLIGLPDEVARLTRVSLVLLLPWPGAIGYRRFYQGLLIRGNRTRLVAYGTVIRLATMTTTALVLYHGFDVPGAWVGAAALSAGVGIEAVASRWMAIGTVRRFATAESGDETFLTYRSVWTFYYPLALTATIGLAVHPLVTFLIWGSRSALESQAVLPVINALSFIFRSAGLSFHEVAIALLGRSERNLAPVRRFAAVLGTLSTLGLALVAWTPLAEFWFRGVSGLSVELTEFAIVPTRILTLLPALSVLLSLQRAVLVHDRNTAPISWSTVAEVVGIAVVLALMIRRFDVVGATAASIAYVAGRIVGVLVLVPPLSRRQVTPGRSGV